MALATDIQAYWKFDESSGNAADSVGSLTLTNTGISYTTGKINNGADCGTSVSVNKVFVGGTPVWNMAAGAAKSYAFWFKCNANPTAFARVLDWRRSAGSGGEHSLHYYDDGGYKFQMYLNGNNVSVAQAMTVGTWYHIAMTCDASNNVKLYFNGSVILTGTWGSTGTGSNFTQINGANGGTTGNFSGPFSFDEFGVWNKELTSAEVTELINGGAGNQYPFSTSVTANAGVQTATFSSPARTVSGAANVSPSALSATFSTPTTSVSGAANVTASVVAATFSIPAVNIITPDAQINAGVLSATFSIPAAVASGDANVTQGTALGATFSIPSPSLQIGYTHAASPLSATFTTPAVEIFSEASVTVSPDPVVATFSHPAVTVSTEQNAMFEAGVLSATFSTLGVTVTGERNLIYDAQVLSATFSIQTPRKVGGLWSPVPRNEGVWTPQPRITG